MADEKSFTGNFAGAAVSDDGVSATISFSTGDGEVSVTIPTEQLPHVIMSASQAAGRATQIRSGEPTARHVLPVEQWRCLPYPDPARFLMEFRIPGGLSTNYSLAKERIPQMIEALRKIQTATPGSTSKN